MGGTSIGRYHVEEVLRVEPLGRVSRASLPELGRRFYVRELHPPAFLPEADRDRLRSAFERECRLLAQLDDPRLPRPYDFGATAEGSRFLAYEEPDPARFGPPPRDRRAWAPEVWTQAGVSLCQVLSALLEAGAVPCQVDPEGLLVAPDGEIRYLPLGLTHFAVRLALPSSLAAPSPYAAPEARDPDASAGPALAYSVGAWLYVMLSGDDSQAARLSTGRPPPLWSLHPAVRASVDDVVQAALRREAAERLSGSAGSAEDRPPDPR